MKGLRRILFSPITMVVLLVILTIALATATFIENDFGSEVAQMKVYNSKWLELILLLLSVNLIGRIFQLKLYKAKKFTIFIFHIAFVFMIIGAGITRYNGYEGTMRIREGNSSSTLITNQKIISLAIEGKNNKTQTFKFESNIGEKKTFNKKIKYDGKNRKLSLSKFYNSAYKKALPIENGKAIVGFVLAGNSFRGFEYISSGETKRYGMLSLSFNVNITSDLNIIAKNDSLFLSSPHTITINSMGSGPEAIVNDKLVPIENKKLYKIKETNFVLQEYLPSAKITASPTELGGHRKGMQAMIFTLSDDLNNSEIVLWEDSWNNGEAISKFGDLDISLSYGNKIIELPFSLYLENFVIDRYPGSMSPSSFASYVLLNEEGVEPQPFKIYMNNILKHKGYRFYQSSYDQDEKGTILSVNHDQLGTGITYFSYLLMLIGMLLSIINPNTFLRKTVIRDKMLFVAIILLFTGILNANAQQSENTNKHLPIDVKHSEEFGKLFIQNNNGRTEPVYTYASDIMRKISRKEELLGLTPVQLFLDMNMNPQYWVNMPIIRVTNKELQQHLGLTSKYAAYTDLITPDKGYLLQQMVQTSFAKSPAERSKFDKAIIKTDEKINICYGIYSGQYLKVFPVPGNIDNSKWYMSSEAKLLAKTEEDSLFLANILSVYFEEVDKARESDNYTIADEYLDDIIKFQKNNAGYVLPSEFKTNLEVFYTKRNPFKKLFPFYSSLGILYLFVLIVFIVIGKNTPRILSKFFFYIVLVGFIIHTAGIAIRWYISGHAPMSNGYESMIFISWVTILAGFIFNKRSPFALTATAVLAGLTLMVANLSFMDPQITNLVPVLQSYWLTIHVSVITASYAFLGLGALLGTINLILIILRTDKNQKRIVETVETLTIINHKTLIIGLYFLTIGTFLGAIWANESWGRYWGWDPKETWALISILVYTIVTHARLIPGMKGIFTFNTLSLYGFGSIMMTYFGVNYYLSGLHSYAGGDPVPIPSFVYYTIAAVILLTLAASIKFGRFTNSKNE